MKGHGEKQDWQNTHRAEDSDPESAQNSCHQGEEQKTCSTPRRSSSNNSSRRRNMLVFAAHHRGQIQTKETVTHSARRLKEDQDFSCPSEDRNNLDFHTFLMRKDISWQTCYRKCQDLPAAANAKYIYSLGPSVSLLESKKRSIWVPHPCSRPGQL